MNSAETKILSRIALMQMMGLLLFAGGCLAPAPPADGEGKPTPPPPPSAPNPPDGAMGVSVDADLGWADTPDATSYDVYLGTPLDPPFAGNTPSNQWALGPLNYDATYYWKVVAKNSAGETPGPVWSFTTEAEPPARCEADEACRAAVNWLSTVMDRYHAAFDVYSDADAAGNHFPARGRMSSAGDADALPPMDEAWMENPYAGPTAIKASFQARGDNWGGWYFMNGVLRGAEVAPRENWGDEPNAGIDLSGATKLTFWARGADGGEQVEFFAFGVGRDADTGAPIKPNPDSSRKVSTGYVTLSPEWHEYALDLRGRDLSYVLGGFGWVTNAPRNSNRDITFYLDDIRYYKPRLDEPRFLVSYETGVGTDFDRVMRNVAFVYDNALAALAFMAAGDMERAKLIVDAFLYAQQNDRFYTDGRLRNAYQGGDLWLPPGWTPNGQANTVRMPGWYDPGEQKWLEDRGAVSTSAGNVAWAMLALLAYYEKVGGSQYLSAAQQIGEWVEANCRDTRGAGGYTGGVEGWEPNQTTVSWKSTEHNIDLYVAFERLYGLAGDAKWQGGADHAKRFVLAMWDEADGKFWTGTRDDGVTVNTDVIPLDIQAWAVLALRVEGAPYWRALEYAEGHLKVNGGFDFNQDRDGIWHEGTAQMAVAYQATGQQEKACQLVDLLESAQARFGSGALPASDGDELTTGFDWFYFRRAHVGATAWFILAAREANPFWIGSE
jgi:hypothetical protein